MTSLRVRIQSDGELRYLRRSFGRDLAADGRSVATRSACGSAIAQLEAFFTNPCLPTTVMALRPDHLEAFFVSAVRSMFEAVVQMRWLLPVEVCDRPARHSVGRRSLSLLTGATWTPTQ